MKTEMTDIQKKIYDYLVEAKKQHSYSPAVREIGEAVGLKSPSSVHAHLETLEKKGYIRRVQNKSRTVEPILEEPEKVFESPELCSDDNLLQIPLIGRVAAGEPILAQQNIEGYYPFPAGEIRSRQQDLFMLEVHGDSMINAGILNGDRIIVASTPVANNGDIVVALVDDSATVKRFYKENGYYRLQPENDTMDPIIVKECQIMGKVVALTRIF